jgi:hypothetical protein
MKIFENDRKIFLSIRLLITNISNIISYLNLNIKFLNKNKLHSLQLKICRKQFHQFNLQLELRFTSPNIRNIQTEKK